MLCSREQPARQADRRQDLQRRHGWRSTPTRAVGGRVADRDRARDAQAARHGRRPARRAPACTRSSRTTACAASSTTSSTCSTCRAASSSSCVNDTNNRLVPRLRTVATPVAIFIDSVDEYFNKHIKHRSAQRAATPGELSPSVWYYSQMGLVQVAYELRRISHHLKVFAVDPQGGLRASSSEETSMVQQYRGSAIDLSYTKASLREIFLNNIRREKEKNLCAPNRLRADPLTAFARPGDRHARVHGRGGGRLRLRLPPHAATPARPDDPRPGALRASRPRSAPRRCGSRRR